MIPSETEKGRRSIRFKGYDYSSDGLYYVTVCTQDRACLFGDVIGEEMKLNGVGKMINDFWLNLPSRFKNIELEIFQVMPNHIHGIILVGAGFMPARVPSGFMPARVPSGFMPARVPSGFMPDVGAGFIPALEGATIKVARTKKESLGDVVGAFKSLTTNEYIRNTKILGWKTFNRRLWQRNYYEHIVRDEEDLDRICEYIGANPKAWCQDRNNPSCGATTRVALTNDI